MWDLGYTVLPRAPGQPQKSYHQGDSWFWQLHCSAAQLKPETGKALPAHTHTHTQPSRAASAAASRALHTQNTLYNSLRFTPLKNWWHLKCVATMDRLWNNPYAQMCKNHPPPQLSFQRKKREQDTIELSLVVSFMSAAVHLGRCLSMVILFPFCPFWGRFFCFFFVQFVILW